MQEVNNTLEKFDEILSITTFVTETFRTIGWVLIKFLAWLYDGITDAVNALVKYGDFFSFQQITSIYEAGSFHLLLALFFLVTFVVMGYLIVFDKFKGSRSDIVVNAILAICLIVGLPSAMSTMHGIVVAGMDDMGGAIKLKPGDGTVIPDDMGNTDTQSSAYWIKKNLADLKVYVDADFSGDVRVNGEYRNNINIKKIEKIDFNEAMTTSWTERTFPGVGGHSIDILTHRFNPDGDPVKLESSWLGMDEQYYRYKLDWIPLLTTLLVLTIVKLASGFRIAKIVFNLAFKQIFGMFIATVDIATGQRMKQILQDIMGSFIIIFVSIYLMYLYGLFSIWISDSAAIPALGKTLLYIGGGVAVVSAPSIVERTLGVNAGLSDSWRTMMGTFAAARMGVGVARGAARISGQAARTAAGAGGFAGGMFAGMQNSVNNTSAKNATGSTGASSIPNTNASNGGSAGATGVHGSGGKNGAGGSSAVGHTGASGYHGSNGANMHGKDGKHGDTGLPDQLGRDGNEPHEGREGQNTPVQDMPGMDAFNQIVGDTSGYAPVGGKSSEEIFSSEKNKESKPFRPYGYAKTSGSYRKSLKDTTARSYNTGIRTGENVVNAAKGTARTVRHPIQTARGLQDKAISSWLRDEKKD